MTPAEAVSYYGGRKKLAQVLDVTYAAIVNWERKGYVPEGAAYKLQALTNGALGVDTDFYRSRPKKGQRLPSGL